MLSIITFGIALFGLGVLFICKAVELSFNAATPLTALRRVGDPLVKGGANRCDALCRSGARYLVQTGRRYGALIRREGEHLIDFLVHRIAARLNRYLRGRRIVIRARSEDVSTHLKTVLERENTTSQS